MTAKKMLAKALVILFIVGTLWIPLYASASITVCTPDYVWVANKALELRDRGVEYDIYITLSNGKILYCLTY